MTQNAARARARGAHQSPRDDGGSLAQPAPAVNDPLAPWRAVVANEIDRLRDELAEIVTARALPRIEDSSGMCRWLDISMPTLRKLEIEGLPVFRLGECRRYDVDAVRAWLSSRGQT